MKKFLRNLIANKKTELKATEARFEKSTDEAEIRALGETMKSLRDEIDAAEEQLAKLEDDKTDEGAEGTDGTDEGATEGRSVVTQSEVRNGGIIASYAQQVAPQVRAKENVLDTMEYREAFATYVRTGDMSGIAAIEARDAEAKQVLTTDIGKLIPNTVMKEFIKELKVYGNLYNRVRKLNVKGGVEFPIEELVPTITWITETTVSETKSAPEVKTSISFGYHICEARIAQSLLSSIVSIDYLESEIAKLLAEAFIKEFDNVIMNGSGNGQPLGILKDTRVKDANKIKFTDAQLADWTEIRKRFFAKIPLAYRGQGMFAMTVATWETYFMTLKDANNRPLATETFNAEDGTTTCRFAGKEVQLVEPDIIKDYDAATSGEAFAVYFRPQDYAINSQLQVGFKRYFNEDTNKWVNKGLCIMDGKLLDVNGVYLLTKN